MWLDKFSKHKMQGGGFPALTAHVQPRGHGARVRDSDGGCPAVQVTLARPGWHGGFAPKGQRACVLRGSGHGEGYTRSESRCQIRVTMQDPSHDARSESRCQIRVKMPDQSQEPEPTLSKTSPSRSTVGCFKSHCRLATSLRQGTSVAAGSSCSLRLQPGNLRLWEQTQMLPTKPCGEQLAVWDSHPSQLPADL